MQFRGHHHDNYDHDDDGDEEEVVVQKAFSLWILTLISSSMTSEQEEGRVCEQT